MAQLLHPTIALVEGTGEGPNPGKKGSRAHPTPTS